MLHRILDHLEPETLKSINGWAFDVWVALSIISAIWLRDSIVWIVFMSAYAIDISHATAYLAARAEIEAHKESP